MQKHYLSSVFEPASIAIIGASEQEHSVGELLLKNIQQGGFQGPIFPVNPKYEEIGGLSCYASVKKIKRKVELAIIVTPARAVAKVLRDCGEHGVSAAIILSAGFAEAGKRGKALQSEILDIARSYNIRMVGPNCLGVMRPAIGMNATFTKSEAREGRIALVAQSGAFCSALLDWAESNGFGFSAVASLGGAADVGFGDVLEYLAVDYRTDSILLYVEGINNARSFISGLRVAARLKPVIVVKSGRNESATRAAVSHTGSMVGRDNVFDAAIQRAGAVRVKSVNELFSAARLLGSGARVKGARLAIVTNGGGPGVMAADRAADLGVPLAELSENSIKQLSEVLPEYWSHADPVDVLGDANAERYGAATKIVLADPGVDGVLVLLAPQAMTDPDACAEAVINVAAKSDKPVLACWMGEGLVARGRSRFDVAGIAHFNSPETGVEAFGYLASYRANQKILLETPAPLSQRRSPDVDSARLIIENAMSERRHVLSSVEAKAVLSAFRIPISPSINVTTPAEALVAAQTVGLPVAMKINSPDIPHKTDVGGVQLNIIEAPGVRTAFREIMENVKHSQPGADILGVTVERMQVRPHAREVRIGISHDEVFGPVISFGIGGTEVEIFADCNIALPPLNNYLSLSLVEGTRAARLLRRFRNLPEVNFEQLLDILKGVSEISCELPEIQELDINPLLIDETDAIVADARIVVSSRHTGTARYGHMAIHPYPHELVSHWQLANGTDVVVRPIRPEDARIEQEFVQNLSSESKYFRFMQTMEELTPALLARFTQIDYDREMALVVVANEGQPGAHLLGVARYITNPDRRSCEFALTVADGMQRQGIGRELMRRLMGLARARNIDVMEGEVLSNNTKMLALCTRLGFRIVRTEERDVVKVRRHLND